MGTLLPQNASILGLSMIEVRDVLRSISRAGHDVGSFIRTPPNAWESGGLLGGELERAMAWEEMLDRGFVDYHPTDEDRDGVLTDAGRGIAWSKTKRYPLATAKRVLEETLARIAAHNADDTQLHHFHQVWLFGSALREEETVGDLDLVVIERRNPLFDDHEKYRQRQRELRMEAPASASYIDSLFWHRKRALFGPRRHPLLAGADADLNTLIDMAVPCRLVFDAERGGRVDDPVLAKHPRATTRQENINPPLALPDLAPPTAPLRPSDARWICSHRDTGYFDSIWIPREDQWISGALLTEWGGPKDGIMAPLVADRATGNGRETLVLSWHLQSRESLLDPRARERTPDGHGCALSIERCIDGTADDLRVHCRVLDERWSSTRFRTRRLDEIGHATGAAIAKIVANDLMRGIRRAEDLGLPEPKARLVLDTTAVGPDLARLVAEGVSHQLFEDDLALIHGWGDAIAMESVLPQDGPEAVSRVP